MVTVVAKRVASRFESCRSRSINQSAWCNWIAHEPTKLEMGVRTSLWTLFAPAADRSSAVL